MNTTYSELLYNLQRSRELTVESYFWNLGCCLSFVLLTYGIVISNNITILSSLFSALSMGAASFCIMRKAYILHEDINNKVQNMIRKREL